MKTITEDWILDQIDDTLRKCQNCIPDDSCLGRDINQARVCIQKIMAGEEITGHERLEKCRKS